MKSLIQHRFSFSLLLLMILPLVGCGQKPITSDNWVDAARSIPREQDRNSVVTTLLNFAESPTMEPYFAHSYGCVVFPTIGKGGIGIGGAHGKGYVFRQGTFTGESTMTQLSIGFQLGGQAFSQIIFFEDEDAYNTFTRGNFELSANASAVALTIGASVQADTAGGGTAAAGKAQAKRDYTNGMAIFTVAKGGLMYEASVGGQKFTFRPAAAE